MILSPGAWMFRIPRWDDRQAAVDDSPPTLIGIRFPLPHGAPVELGGREKWRKLIVAFTPLTFNRVLIGNVVSN